MGNREGWGIDRGGRPEKIDDSELDLDLSGLKSEPRHPKPHLPIEPFPKLVEVRDLSCSGCGRLCRYESSSSEVEGPGSRVQGPVREFLRAHPDIWLSFVVDPRTDTLDVVAACSEACVQRVLRK